MNSVYRTLNLSDGDVQHNYDGHPFIQTRTKKVYNVPVDPFPAYPHNHTLIASEINEIEDKFKLDFDVWYHNLSHEMVWRVNGAADFYTEPLEGWVVLSGKRIPIHPGVTRYLIAHEYGHIVFRWLQHHIGPTFLEEYQLVRRLTFTDSLEARSWHKNFEEIAVNDFRILVGERESEFWPHTVWHPNEVKGLKDLWKELKQQYAK